MAAPDFAQLLKRGITVKRVLTALTAVVGVGLVVAAGGVLVDGHDSYVPSVSDDVGTDVVRPVADQTGADGALRVPDPQLVVNTDGSAAVGAFVENGTDVDVALESVTVWVDRIRLPINATQMWLPVPAGDRAQVGAASDAGGFVVPRGLEPAMRADVQFRFDDGTCVQADVTAVARTKEHRRIYPTSNRALGPTTSLDPPPASIPCEGESSTVSDADADADAVAEAQDEVADAVAKKAGEMKSRHELRVTIRDTPAGNDPDESDAYEATSATECSVIVWGEDSQRLGELVVTTPDTAGELTHVKMFGLPGSARLLPDGSCEASMTLHLPYASRYVLGVGIVGRGIRAEDAPEPPVVITQGDSQSVVVPS